MKKANHLAGAAVLSCFRPVDNNSMTSNLPYQFSEDRGASYFHVFIDAVRGRSKKPPSV